MPMVVSIGGSPDPTYDFPEKVDHHAPFGSRDPAVVGNPDPAELLGATDPAYRMNQLDAVAVHYAQQGKPSQEA